MSTVISTSDISEYINSLSILEISELVNEFEDKFSVTSEPKFDKEEPLNQKPPSVRNNSHHQQILDFNKKGKKWN